MLTQDSMLCNWDLTEYDWTMHLLGAVCAPRQEETEPRCMHVLYTCDGMQCR